MKGLGDEVLERKEREERLRHLFEKVPAGRVRVLEHEPPELDEVGLRRFGAEVIVVRALE